MSRSDHPAGRKRIHEIPKICPRCVEHNWIPNNKNPGLYPGALSRTDNETEVCSACGEDEAMVWFQKGNCQPQSEWPVQRMYNFGS